MLNGRFFVFMDPSLKATLALVAKHVWKYRGRFLVINIAVVIAVGSETVVPWYLKQFFDGLTTLAPGQAGLSVLLQILLMIALIRFISWIAWRVQGFLVTDFQPRVMKDLQTASFDHLLQHSYRFYANNFAGSLVRKVNRLARGFERLADEYLYRLLPLAVILVGSTIGLYLRFPVVAWVFLGWMILFVIANYFASVWKLKTDVKRSELDSEATGVLADVVSNNVNVKLFSGSKDESVRFHDVMEAWRKWQTIGWNRGEWIFALQGFLIFAVEIVLLYIGARFWAEGVLTVGDFVFFQAYLIAASGKLWDIGRSMRNVFEAVADAKEMVELLETPHEVRDIPTAKVLKVKDGKVEFKNVTFNYHSTRSVLNDFSLLIEPRQKVAFVGPSGAGKSTITKLLFRFFDVDDGKILIDGQNIMKVTQDSLRNEISLVPQEPVLFHRSLMDNIRYGRRDATDEEVIEAAKKAHCHEFIDALPDKYDTFVGERGIKLSGGERQRVAIARAILKNAPILVLDEATSSLDSESERLIQDALRKLMKKKTVIVIAHRLSTIMEMDRIVVVEHGKITADGTHGELLDLSKTYAKLWSIQAGGFLP